MPVIRQFPGQACQRCSSAIDLPHLKPIDCRDAIHKELDVLMRRVRRLTDTRARIVQQRADEIRKLLQPPTAKRKIR